MRPSLIIVWSRRKAYWGYLSVYSVRSEIRPQYWGLDLIRHGLILKVLCFVLDFPNALYSAGLYGKRNDWKEKSFSPKLYLCSLLRWKVSLPPPYFSTVCWTWSPHPWKFSGFYSQLKEVFGTYNYHQLKHSSTTTQAYLASCSLEREANNSTGTNMAPTSYKSAY